METLQQMVLEVISGQNVCSKIYHASVLVWTARGQRGVPTDLQDSSNSRGAVLMRRIHMQAAAVPGLLPSSESVVISASPSSDYLLVGIVQSNEVYLAWFKVTTAARNY